MGSGTSENASATDAADLVLEIVKEMSPAGVTELKPDTKLVAELGFDSLGLVELVVALEDSLDLPPLDITVVEGITQVADLQRVVSEAQARMPSD